MQNQEKKLVEKTTTEQPQHPHQTIKKITPHIYKIHIFSYTHYQ